MRRRNQSSDHISYENDDKTNPDALAVNVFTKPPKACTFCECSKDNKVTLTEENRLSPLHT